MNKRKKNLKLYVIKKYVWAKDAKEALSREMKFKPDDVWIDEEWKRNSNLPKDAIGFYVPNESLYD